MPAEQSKADQAREKILISAIQEFIFQRKKNSQLLTGYDAMLWDPKVNQKDARGTGIAI